MASRFVVNVNDTQEYQFTFVDSQDETILIGGTYPDLASAEEAIKDVKLNSLMSQQLAAGKTPNDEQFFVIKGSDGHVLVKSVLFTSQMVMDNALHCVKDNACIAETEVVVAQVA